MGSDTSLDEEPQWSQPGLNSAKRSRMGHVTFSPAAGTVRAASQCRSDDGREEEEEDEGEELAAEKKSPGQPLQLPYITRRGGSRGGALGGADGCHSHSLR